MDYLFTFRVLSILFSKQYWRRICYFSFQIHFESLCFILCLWRNLLYFQIKETQKINYLEILSFFSRYYHPPDPLNYLHCKRSKNKQTYIKFRRRLQNVGFFSFILFNFLHCINSKKGPSCYPHTFLFVISFDAIDAENFPWSSCQTLQRVYFPNVSNDWRLSFCNDWIKRN